MPSFTCFGFSTHYTVHLIDAIPRHIQQAQEAAKQQPDCPLERIIVGDARHLDYDDQSVNVVLLLGPLYHLTERVDRLKALEESHRVLHPNGLLMAVGISRFISTINCLTEGMITDPVFVPLIERDLQDGQHRNPTDDPSYFTTSFFHHPDELAAEVSEAGFQLESLLAIEGPARLVKDFADHWQVKERREWLLKIVRQLESEPYLLGVSAHIMAVARKL